MSGGGARGPVTSPTLSDAAAEIHVSEITDAAGLDRLQGEWDALLRATPHASPFQSWEWQSAWWQSFGNGKLWVLVARRGGRLVGLAPLFIERYYGLPLRRVRLVGAPLSDYLDLIAEPEHAEACRDAFLGHLAGAADRWDLLDFTDVPERSPLAQERPVEGLGLSAAVHRICPYLELPPTWDRMQASLGKNLRANIGRRQRQVARDFKAEYDTVGAADLDAGLEDLFRLHNLRWQRRGMPGAFAGHTKQRFHREVARRFLDRGWLLLHRLRLDGRTQAAFYCFRLGGTVYYYLSGFSPELSRYSLGTVVMAHAVAEAISGGAGEFDLLRGDETYKYHWRALERRTMRVVGWKRSLRSRCALIVNRIERYIEREGLRLQRRLWGHRREKPAERTSGAAPGPKQGKGP